MQSVQARQETAFSSIFILRFMWAVSPFSCVETKRIPHFRAVVDVLGITGLATAEVSDRI